MRSYISYDELEELGETIVRAYINKTRRYNALCVDIEGLVTDYLYYATGTHAPIVEKDLFEKVQVLLKKRKEQFTKATTQNIYPLSSRIRCSECGSFYRRKVRSGGVKWVCARHEEDFKACNSNYYSEERRRGTHVACGEQPSGHRYS